MPNLKIYPFLVLLTFTALACNTVTPQSEPTTAPTRFQPTLAPTQIPPTQAELQQAESDVPRVSVEKAKAAFDSGEAVIVDVRGAEFFAQEHIAGAVNIPLANIENNPAGVNLDKNQWIITYCT